MKSKTILDGNYVIYEDGNLYSNLTKRFLKGGFTCRDKKYRCYCLCLNGKNKTFFAHRLVAENFIPNLKSLPQTNHIDGNSKNNDINNLEWCTASHNIKHAYDTGLLKTDVILSAKYKYHCSICGKYSQDSLCHICKDSVKAQNKKKNKYKYLGKHIPKTDLHSKILHLLVNGCSQPEVARIMAISNQRISQVVNEYKII